jgi:hypothetical protein
MANQAPTNSPHRTLIALFDELIETIEKDVGYYQSRAWRFRYASRALLSIGLSALAFGVLAPFIERLIPGMLVPHVVAEPSDILALGYAALVVAGLAIGTDRGFVASQGWSRFVLAQLHLEALRNQVALDRHEFALTAADDEAAKGQVEKTINRLRERENARADIVENETRTWVGELGAALAEFEKRIAAATGEAAHNNPPRR